MGQYRRMARPFAERLAWAALAFSGLVHVAGMAFAVVSGSGDSLLVVFFVFALVGAPVAARQPRNPIGWILLAIGFAWGLNGFLNAYALYALETHVGSLPRPDLSIALGYWLWVPAVGLMGTFLLLLFPDGRLPSSRWRPLGWLSAFTLILLSTTSLFQPGPWSNTEFSEVNNPLGIQALRPVLFPIQVLGIVLLLASIVGCAVSLIQRFRSSRGQERYQMKWLAAGATLTTGAYLSLFAALGLIELLNIQATSLWFAVLEEVTVPSFLLIPVAIGIAVLKYRLYDIDLIVNRALVYACLTAVLAVVYTAGVVGAGIVVRAATGQATNNLAVAASTLAVAGLFRPARARIQGFIDRRFYRRKYDAARTMEAFSARLRDEVDLETLNAEFLTVVRDTMQPTHASVWLKH